FSVLVASYPRTDDNPSIRPQTLRRPFRGEFPLSVQPQPILATFHRVYGPLLRMASGWRAADAVMLLVFALTLFTSANLLMTVQPMIGKLSTPLLGGTPAVRNTCMVFFMTLLLAGYCYAHFTTRCIRVRKQAALHLAVLSLPFLFFPIAVNKDRIVGGVDIPIPQLLLLLAASVGVPFFVVSTSAPLLQKWFSGTSHPAARDPYFLYAASNLGSLLGLLSYPTLIEP